jgi:hypothetical protein
MAAKGIDVMETRAQKPVAGRVGVGVLGALLLLGAYGGQARAEDTAAPAGAVTPGKTSGKTKTKKSRKARPKEIDPEAAPKPAAAKKRKVGGGPIYVLGGGTGAHHIDENAPKIRAFPQEAAAVDKAFAETRRDQLVDAERTARAPKQADRWRTVLFSLRGLDDHIDPETCFWRILSFYRLDEVARARAVRQACELPSKDSIVLNGEDTMAAGTPIMGAEPEPTGGTTGTTGENKPAGAPTGPPPVPPYTGPSPQRYK